VPCLVVKLLLTIRLPLPSVKDIARMVNAMPSIGIIFGCTSFAPRPAPKPERSATTCDLAVVMADVEEESSVDLRSN